MYKVKGAVVGSKAFLNHGDRMAGTGKRLFVIDCDAGLDDAQAILMALAAPDVQVLAITTTHGNSGVDNVCRNVLRLLKVAGRLDIPVYKGATKSLINEKLAPNLYHGKDGFGDVPDADQPSDSLIKPQHAVTTLLELAETYRGGLTLVCLGPLTNIALALRLDPEFGSKLKECFIMGGNYKGEGNITTSAEFNFHSDPEAAKVTLDELGCHITLATWELCKEHSLSWDTYKSLREPKTTLSQFMERVEAYVVNRCKSLQWPRYITCDEVAMSFALDPRVKGQSQKVYATLELCGTLTRGQVVVDWAGKLGKQPNVEIVTSIDEEIYLTLLRSAVR